MRWCILLISFSVIQPALSQPLLTGAATEWSDNFREWTIYTADESVTGELRTRWQTRDEQTEWDYRVGEHSGQIRQKWKGNPNEWEIRGDNQIVSARTVWNNDFREWRISDGRTALSWRTRLRNSPEEWVAEDEQAGYFGMYTSWEGDPREWTIADEMDPTVHLPLKMAMTFIALFHSTPE